jgi:hypothetical protein
LSSLTTIPKGVTLTVGDSLYLSSLTTIPKGVTLTVGGHLDLSSLTTIPKGVTLTVGDSLYLSSLTTIPKGVTLTVGDSLYLSSLTTIPKGVTLTVGGYLDLSSLTTIPKGVTLTVGGYLDLSSLTTIPKGVTLTVGDSLYLSSLTTIPKGVTLTVGDSLYLSSKTLPATITRPWFESPCKKYLIADGKASEIMSKDRRIYTVRHLGTNKNSYVAVSPKFCAHGKTAKEAKDDLRFKQAQHRMANEPITNDTVITVDRYRVITGACREGARSWMKSNNISDGIRAVDLLPILRKTNAYGLSNFEKLLV